MMRGGVRAFLTPHPWSDYYELRLVSDGIRPAHAESVHDGQFVYREHADGELIESVLKLSHAEVDALLEALKQHARPVDATMDALRDTREVRDRLLTLVERTVSTRGNV